MLVKWQRRPGTQRCEASSAGVDVTESLWEKPHLPPRVPMWHSQELAELDRQDSASLKSECRRLGVPADHLRQQARLLRLSQGYWEKIIKKRKLSEMC